MADYVDYHVAKLIAEDRRRTAAKARKVSQLKKANRLPLSLKSLWSLVARF
jgi:hypothetical protein